MALIVLSLIFNKFAFLTIAFGVVAVYELSLLTSKNGQNQFYACGLDVFGMICLTALPVCHMCSYIPFLGALYVILVALYLLYFVLRVLLAIYTPSKDALQMLAYSLFGQLYLGVGLISAEALSLVSPLLVLILFILIWLNDTGAYLVGSTLGKHKMFPRLSPKKSWEGFFGGLVFCLIAGVVFYITGAFSLSSDVSRFLHLGFWKGAIIIPVVVVAFATWGDLFESLIKRTFGAKDSGNIIPGHGGILDRIDSMLFVMPGVIMTLFFLSL